MELGGTYKLYPTVGSMVTRREAEGLIDMDLGFLGVTAKNLGKTDNSVSVGQISIQDQRALTFGNASGNAVADDMDSAHHQVSESMFGSQRQRPSQSRFG